MDLSCRIADDQMASYEASNAIEKVSDCKCELKNEACAQILSHFAQLKRLEISVKHFDHNQL
jgi:hypothetical protein